MKKPAYRHGEVVIIPVADNTNMDGATLQEDLLLGHSETGHHHILEGGCLVKELGAGNTLFKVTGSAKVVHKKDFDRHEDHNLPEGIYLTYKKSEYDPFADVIREVRD